MSKLKRLKRRRALQKKANIRQMALQRNSKATLGSPKLLKRMTRDHQDVLQNIEFVMVSGWREDRRIDDCTVAETLMAAINGEVSEGALAQSLAQKLEAIRQFRSDVSDDIWQDCLRVVLQSVHRHSSGKLGSRGYLDFVSNFVF